LKITQKQNGRDDVEAMELGEWVVHEWLVVEMGAEVVLENLNNDI
jgi:hypothetical protein